MVDAADTLRKHGLPVTAQRVAILAAVHQHPHATADEVAEQVRAKLGSISRQSVYNALNVLTERGIIRRIQPADSPARYEDRVGDNHHHLVCRSCGRTEDVCCATGKTPCLHASEQHGFAIDEAEVIYWGLCPSCRGGDHSSRPYRHSHS
jgi:Fur family ferric uptake transcriptional regulator